MKKITLFCKSNANASALCKTHLLLVLLLVNSICWAQLTVFDNVTSPPRSLHESDGKLYTRLNGEIRVWENLPQNTDTQVLSNVNSAANGFTVENNILYYTNSAASNVVRWDLTNSTQTTIGNYDNNGVTPNYVTIVNGFIVYIVGECTYSGVTINAFFRYQSSNDSFSYENGLGSGEITGVKTDGNTIYILKKSGVLLSVDTSNNGYQVIGVNNEAIIKKIIKD